MRSRFAAWLCLIGAAACSHNNPEPVNTADDVNQPSVANTEPAMTPASLETHRATTAESTSPVLPPSTTASSNPSGATNDGSGVRTPVAADTRAGSSGSTNSAPSTAGGPVQPDNTKVNERDRNAGAQTPPDQKENESDLKITQHVRQAVMADGSLSFTAKNVKIITQSGKVTLRGPVKTAQERDAIEAAARKVAGVTQVDNQIEVKK